MTEKRAGARPASIKPKAHTVDLEEESTVEDGDAHSGKTNVDSAQSAGPSPGLPVRRAYRVLVNHDEHSRDDVIELEPNGRTVALVDQGYLEPVA